MKDIYDIYEPVYSSSINPLFIIIPIIAVVIIFLIFILLKKRTKKEKVDYLERALTDLLLLKKNHNLTCQNFAKKVKAVFFTYYQIKKGIDLSSFTPDEIENILTDLICSSELLTVLKEFESVLYSKKSLSMDNRVQALLITSNAIKEISEANID